MKKLEKVIEFLLSKGFKQVPYPRSMKFILFEKGDKRYWVGRKVGNVRRGETIGDSIAVSLKIA